MVTLLQEYDVDKVLEDVLGEEFVSKVEWNGNTPVTPLRCIKCKSREFQVGQGCYETVIKCNTCNYEVCIHSG